MSTVSVRIDKSLFDEAASEQISSTTVEFLGEDWEKCAGESRFTNLIHRGNADSEGTAERAVPI